MRVVCRSGSNVARWCCSVEDSRSRVRGSRTGDLTRCVLRRMLLTRSRTGSGSSCVRSRWASSSPGEAMQVVIPSTRQKWFDEEQLRERAIEGHGSPGARCSVCGTWRWMPMGWGSLPPVLDPSVVNGYDIVAGPEWFGDGWSASRRILVRRELAELLRDASPRDFAIHDVSELAGLTGSEPDWLARPVARLPAGAVSEVFVGEPAPGISRRGRAGDAGPAGRGGCTSYARAQRRSGQRGCAGRRRSAILRRRRGGRGGFVVAPGRRAR